MYELNWTSLFSRNQCSVTRSTYVRAPHGTGNRPDNSGRTRGGRNLIEEPVHIKPSPSQTNHRLYLHPPSSTSNTRHVSSSYRIVPDPPQVRQAGHSQGKGHRHRPSTCRNYYLLRPSRCPRGEVRRTQVSIEYRTPSFRIVAPFLSMTVHVNWSLLYVSPLFRRARVDRGYSPALRLVRQVGIFL